MLHHLISQEAALTVINEQKLQTIYAKLKSREKIHSEQIQQFIRISIAFTHILKLTAWDLKAIQETTTAQIKQSGTSEWIDQKDGMIKVSERCIFCLKRMEKKEDQAHKKEGMKKKRAEKQANSQLA